MIIILQYFAPDADGNSTSITLAGIVDGDLAATSIEFTSSLTGETSSGTVTSTDTSASADATSDATDTSTADSTDTTTDDSTDTATDDTADTTTDDTADTTTDDTTSTDDSASSQSYTVVDIATATEDTTITATDAAEEFRYEFSGSTSSEGNFIITIDNFDSANDKIVLVNVGGNDLTTSEFTELSGVEISGNSFDNQTRILFDKDSSGGSGELAVNGVYDSDLSIIAIEILSDTNIT